MSNLFDKVKQGLSRTRTAMSERIVAAVRGGGRLDDDVIDEIEAVLIQADVGVETAMEIVDELRDRVQEEKIGNRPEDVVELLKAELAGQVAQDQGMALTKPGSGRPHVILVVGVNGVGKTTTVGKLAKHYTDAGNRVLVAACDTFRAAAIPQLEIWADRAGVDMVRPQEGADPAAVAFDALAAARARDLDVLLVDTAGRLHNRVNLMEELKKIHRSLGKQDPAAPHETLLVLDATTGQNTLAQAREFNQATRVTGLVLTKLDGTAKGGIVLALRRELGIPVQLIGVGEGLDDLQPFQGHAFVEALFD